MARREAIAALQTNNVHAFQRPDDDVAYDPTRTSLRGDAERVSFSKFGGGVTRFQTCLQRFSPGFETNDIGYQQRADQQMFRNWFALQFQKPTRYYRKAFFNFNAQERVDHRRPRARQRAESQHARPAAEPVVGALRRERERPASPSYGDRDARGGPAIRRSKNASGWAGFESDDRKPLTYSDLRLVVEGRRRPLVVGRRRPERQPPRLQPLLRVDGRQLQPQRGRRPVLRAATATSAATRRTTPSRGSTRRRSA